MSDKFIQGYACAVASIISGHGECTATREALMQCGLTSVKKLREAGVDDFDVVTLKPVIKGMQRDMRYKKARDSARMKR